MATAAAPPPPPGDDLPQAPSSAIFIPDEETRTCTQCGRKFLVSHFLKEGAKKTTILKQCDECRGTREKSYAEAKHKGADVLSSPTRRRRSPKRLQGQPSYAQPIAASAARTTARPRPLRANALQPAVNPTLQRPPLRPADRPLITLGSPITPTPPWPPCSNTIQGRGRSSGAAVGNSAGRGTEPPATVGSGAAVSLLPGSRIPMPTFLPHGQYSPDPPEVAAARRDLGAIKRQHRADRRAGQQPSSTPSLSSLVARGGITAVQCPSLGLSGGLKSSEQPYFKCYVCEINRANRRRVHGDPDVCLSCADGITHQEPMRRQKWCLVGHHEAMRTFFFDDDGNEHLSCNRCIPESSPIGGVYHLSPSSAPPSSARSSRSSQDYSAHNGRRDGAPNPLQDPRLPHLPKMSSVVLIRRWTPLTRTSRLSIPPCLLKTCSLFKIFTETWTRTNYRPARDVKSGGSTCALGTRASAIVVATSAIARSLMIYLSCFLTTTISILGRCLLPICPSLLK
ncbi:hypothetical protein MPH_13670 [Macrophomina phaseolina MS6]|uniref:Stc1 domain-containing protein n=1 Tax=Macrophomina phaseolina (strain MS6) TaxID=1126212 RepID=K2RGT0_MACPH|nr:hypothetical protein MPH_13670 [Macrophomina phaseolina MS6]